jgi:predicted ArsR family transcriptional regulator
MNTYQLIVEFFRTSMNFNSPLSLRQACLGGTLAVSYTQARRVVKKASARGDIQIQRAEDEQGRPLKVTPK